MNLIDIIIPIYNCEKYIPRLIDSIEKQTLKDYRVIFIDDGSSDSSCDVINNCLKDKQIDYILLQQVNNGAASARNYGLENSTAEWVVFVDGDDILTSKYLEYLYNGVVATKSDFGFAYYQSSNSDENYCSKDVGQLAFKSISPNECMRKHYTEWIGPCCLIINREWMVNKGIIFDNECIYCEDIPFVTELISNANSIVEIKNEIYIYIIRQGSASKSPKIEKFVNGINCFNKIADKLEENEVVQANKVFKSMGRSRYLLATLRVGAVQLDFNHFLMLTKYIDINKYKRQLKRLSLFQRIAGNIYLMSKTLFYVSIRNIFR